jgi:hypothetical protein
MFGQIIKRKLSLFQIVDNFIVIKHLAVIRGEYQTRAKSHGRKQQIGHVDVFLFDVDDDRIFAAVFEEFVGELASENERNDERCDPEEPENEGRNRKFLVVCQGNAGCSEK